MSLIPFQKSQVVPISINNKFHTTVDVLRLDVIHPVVSGNKWFKLKNYLQDALENKKKTVLTFGGPFSNHIVATAAASHYNKIKSIGIIRGERPKTLSDTIQQALSYNMELHFIPRSDYKKKSIPGEVWNKIDPADVYIINEGGYGKLGMLGAMEIFGELNNNDYTHIIAAVGTGTMLSGLITAAHPDQKIIGIPVLKDDSLEQGIKTLLLNKAQSFQLIYDYHFGGYARSSHALIQFMNCCYQKNAIPTDFVYTGKLFYAVNDLLEKAFFPKGSKILIIHSGGLQGNQSLPPGTLIY